MTAAPFRPRCCTRLHCTALTPLLLLLHTEHTNTAISHQHSTRWSNHRTRTLRTPPRPTPTTVRWRVPALRCARRLIVVSERHGRAGVDTAATSATGTTGKARYEQHAQHSAECTMIQRARADRGACTWSQPLTVPMHCSAPTRLLCLVAQMTPSARRCSQRRCAPCKRLLQPHRLRRQ